MSEFNEIAYSNNFNNKLENIYITEIKLSNDEKYKVGNKMKITYKDTFVKNVDIISIKKIMLSDINTYTAGMVFGNTPEYARGILSKMYTTHDLTKEPLMLLLLKTVKP